MSGSRRTAGIAVIVLVTVAAGVLAAGPDRGSLLAAWEESVRTDPQTTRFERLDDGRYAFATERFPFEGQLEVIEVVVDDRSLEGPMGTAVGQVVVELEGVDEGFRQRHATSIGLWQSGSSLVWDADEARWIGGDEWSRRVQDRFGWSWAGWLSGAFWIVVLVILVVVLGFLSRRATRQMKRAMEAQDQALSDQRRALDMNLEALELTRESNRLLAAILAELRGRDYRSEAVQPPTEPDSNPSSSSSGPSSPSGGM